VFKNNINVKVFLRILYFRLFVNIFFILKIKTKGIRKNYYQTKRFIMFATNMVPLKSQLCLHFKVFTFCGAWSNTKKERKKNH
jgi:hypothetical protein